MHPKLLYISDIVICFTNLLQSKNLKSSSKIIFHLSRNQNTYRQVFYAHNYPHHLKIH